MFWKIYFCFIAIIAIRGYYCEKFRIWEIIDFDFFVLAMLGFFAFCWQKKMFNWFFWKIFFPVYVSWSIYYQYFIPRPEMPSSISTILEEPQYIRATETLAFYIPVIAALYLYAFRRNNIWSG